MGSVEAGGHRFLNGHEIAHRLDARPPSRRQQTLATAKPETCDSYERATGTAKKKTECK